MIPFEEIPGYALIRGAEEPLAVMLMVRPCACGAYPRYNYFNGYEPEEHTLNCACGEGAFSIFSQEQLVENWNSKNNY